MKLKGAVWVCVVVGLVVCSFWSVRVLAGERKSFEEFVAESKEMAADGDEVAGLFVDMLNSFSETGDITGLDKGKVLSAALPVAESGDETAQSLVGQIYYELGDSEKAAYFFEKAADQGQVNACFFIGSMYVDGDGVSKDTAKGIKYLEQAGRMGSLDAQAALGTIFRVGSFGVAEDLEKARYWAELAAEQGHAEMQYLVGVMYRDGQGGAVDYGKAQIWLEKAAEQLDNPVLWSEVGSLYLSVPGKNDLSDQYKEVKCDDGKAYYWIKKAAENGFEGAQELLGSMYLNGYYVDINYEEAFKWYSRAAEGGGSFAFVHLGWMYHQGYYVKQDIGKAIEYYELSVENGNHAALPILARMFYNGEGVEVDRARALDYYRKGAEMGNAYAADKLSKLTDESLDSK